MARCGVFAGVMPANLNRCIPALPVGTAMDTEPSPADVPEATVPTKSPNEASTSVPVAKPPAEIVTWLP
jgi:hypothetical protein